MNTDALKALLDERQWQEAARSFTHPGEMVSAVRNPVLAVCRAELAALEAGLEQHRKMWEELWRGDCSTDEEKEIFRSIFGPGDDELRIVALEAENAAMREALNALVLSADYLQGKLDQEDPDVIAVRLDLDEADLALTLPTKKVLVDVEKLREWSGVILSLAADKTLRISVKPFLDQLAALLKEKA